MQCAMPFWVSMLLQGVTPPARYILSARRRLRQKALCSSAKVAEQLATLGDDILPTEGTVESCERFICSLYTNDRKAGNRADLERYWMFCQKHQKNESLLSTSDSLSHHINRANYQAYVWEKSLCKEQDVPSPEGNGWETENGRLIPTLMSKDPAPTSLLELTICKCNRSACKRNDLRLYARQTAFRTQKPACA